MSDKWLPTDEEVQQAKLEFVRDLIAKDTFIFERPGCAGYWLYGVEYRDDVGWLAYEFGHDESIDYVAMDHSAATERFKAGLSVPEHYWVLNQAFAEDAFVIGCRKWGVDWRDTPPGVDYGDIDNLIQWTLFKEIRYA
jgi:hypothetical protein